MSNEVCEIIAGQLDNTRPDILTPGRDVGMQPLDDAQGALGIYIGPRERVAVVAYDEGWDEYDVAVVTSPGIVTVRSVTDLMTFMLKGLRTTGELPDPHKVYRRVGPDQMGEWVWGDDAKPFSLPLVMTKFGDDDWEVIA